MSKKFGRNHIAYRIFLYFSLILVSLLLIEKIAETDLTFGDSSQYWAAGRLLLQKQNPYDPQEVVGLRNSLGGVQFEVNKTVSMMLYPPWTLLFILPFGVFSYSISRVLWLLTNISFIVLSLDLIWRIYSFPPKLKWFGFLFGFTFSPTIYVLLMGHINPLFLLGIAVFISLEQKRTLLSDIAAGSAVIVTLIKLHSTYLLIIAFFLFALSKRRWGLMLGLLLTTVFSSVIVLAFNPSIFSSYLQSAFGYPFDAWATPTIGGFLRSVFGWEYYLFQFLPPIIGIIWLFQRWRRNYKDWQWKNQMPILVLIMLTTTAYGWTYDYVVAIVSVVPVLIALATIKSTSIFYNILIYGSFMFINLFAVYLHAHVSDDYFFWFMPAILTWFYLSTRFINQKAVINTSLLQIAHTTTFNSPNS